MCYRTTLLASKLFGSILSPINSINHFMTNDSKVLLKRGVSEIILKLFSFAGFFCFCKGSPYSVVHIAGHCFVANIFLNISVTGFDISCGSICNIFFGRSPGTPGLVFLDLLICSQTSCSDILGVKFLFSLSLSQVKGLCLGEDILD